MSNIETIFGIFVFASILAVIFFLVRRKANSTANSSLDLTKNSLEASNEEICGDVVLGLETPTGDSILEVSWLSEQAPVPAENMKTISSGVFSRMAPVLQALPSLSQSALANTGNYMRVVINGPLAESKSVVDAFQPYVRDGNGKIQEVAVLKDPKELKKLANLTAVWQAASIVVAQQHLADIADKLQDLSKEVERISKFLDQQRLSRIIAAVDYLNQFNGGIEVQSATPLRNQLEHIERDLLEIQSHIKSELLSLCDESITKSDFFGSGNYSDAILKQIGRVSQLFDQFVFCIKARLVAWQILSAFPGELSIKLVRREGIEKDVRSIFDHDGLVKKLDGHFAVVIDGIHSRINTAETLRKRKSDARNKFNRCTNDLRISSQNIFGQIDYTNSRLLSYHKPVTMEFVFENGQISKAFEINQS